MSQYFFEFGPFRIDIAKRLLRRDGEVVPLTPKTFDLLLALIECRGEVVSKEELMKRVWPDSFVEDGNLTYNISVLRKALGERAGEHHYIVTVPGRGYQFVATVSTARDQDESESSQQKAMALSRVNGDGVPHTAPMDAVKRVSEIRPARSRRPKLILAAIILTSAALIVIGGTWLFRRSAQQPISTIAPKSISVVAVLPLVNGSSDPDMEYLSDGISESLINSLSQLPGLKVIARSSSFKYKGKEIDPQEVARSLGVEAILTGRVVQRGENLLISVELVDARDRTQVWGEQYNRKATDVLAVQSEISHEIAERLRLKLTVAEQLRLAKRGTENPQAYELLLKARFYSLTAGPENRNKT